MRETTFLWIIAIVLAVIFGIIYISNNSSSSVSSEVAQCIGQRALVYVRTGCHACETQEKMFGSSYKYINEVDCAYESDKCNLNGITATPTWVINGQYNVGVQTIPRLQALTGC